MYGEKAVTFLAGLIEKYGPKCLTKFLHSLGEKYGKQAVQDEKEAPVTVCAGPIIERFMLEKKKSLFCTNDRAEIETAISIVLDMDSLKQELRKNDQEGPLTRLVDNYERVLKGRCAKLNFDKMDEEEYAEKVSEIVFREIDARILNNLLIGIYRQMRAKDSENIRYILRAVNAYLAKCGVYSKMIKPGSMLNEEIIEIVASPARKPTVHANEDGLIDEVEKLPYFLDYIDSEGDICSQQSDGKIVVLKYENNRG